jgi:hypothetical protein
VQVNKFRAPRLRLILRGKHNRVKLKRKSPFRAQLRRFESRCGRAACINTTGGKDNVSKSDIYYRICIRAISRFSNPAIHPAPCRKVRNRLL